MDTAPLELLMNPWLAYPLLAAIGFFAGALNVLAGGGSFLTLPLLIFMGLPAGLANGTNRVGILMQNVSAVWSFHREQVLDRRSVFWAAAPATVGAGLGTWLALRTGDADFQRILAALMVIVTLASFWSPKHDQTQAGTGESDDPTTDDPTAPPVRSRTRYAALASGFFVVGLYGGFVQAGVGFLILAATTFAGLDLVRGNAVKVLSVLCFTALSLVMFAWGGKIHWPYGLSLAVGTTLGGHLGARWTLLKGHVWLKRLVTVAVLVFAVRLAWTTAG